MQEKIKGRYHVAAVVAIGFILNSYTNFAQVIKTQDGIIEFVGLKKWTIQMIQNKMTDLAPGKALHACAAELKNELHFPEVSVMFYPSDNGYRVITVIEPHLIDRIQYKKTEDFREKRNSVESWKRISEMIDEDGMNFDIALRTLYYWENEKPDAADQILVETNADRKKCELIWKSFSFLKREEIKRNVFWTIKNDANSKNRLAAVALLINFSEDDSAWHGLIDAFRDPEDQIRTMALTVAWIFNEHHMRNVDWGPAMPSLHHVLRGTNLFGFYFTIKILARSEINPKYAPDLLRDGGSDLILSYLSAEHDTERELAHAFLVQISGTDLGYDKAKWAQWITKITERSEIGAQL